MTPSDVKIVAENINDFIEVPDGINRLRKAVLALAVSGQLVEQNEKEGSAEEFLNQITVKRNSSLNSQPLSDIQFEIPTSWKWVRLGALIDFKIGKTPPRKDPEYWSQGQIPWVSIADLRDGATVSTTKESVNDKALDKVFGGYFAPKGTLLFSFKLTIGKMSILDMDACHNEAIAAFFTHNDTLRDYLFTILPALNLTTRTANAIKGKTLNSETIGLIEVPIPPLEEQKRIVEKVQSVMKQLNELESQKNERDMVRSRLTQSAMKALGSVDSKIAFDHLIELIKTSQDIKELENAILSLVMTGQFTQSYSSTEKPEMWEEKKLDDIAEITSSKRIYKNEYSNQGIPFYRISEISALADGRQIKGELFIDTKRFQEIQERFGAPKTGDVLLTAVGTIGKIYIVREQDTFYFKDGNVLWFRNLNGVNPDFLKLVLTHAIGQMRNISNGAVYKALTIVKLKELKFMMPPLPEQKRIVKKVEELVKMLNSVRSIIDA